MFVILSEQFVTERISSLSDALAKFWWRKFR